MRFLLLTAGVLLWGVAFAASIQLHKYDLSIGDGICGPWGCAAEPEALLGAHLLWLTLLAPTLVLVCRTLGPPYSRRLASVTLAVGLTVAGGVVLWGAIAWLRAGEPPRYALQRGLFLVAANPDLPAIPLALSGWIGDRLLRSRNLSPRQAAEEPVS